MHVICHNYVFNFLTNLSILHPLRPPRLISVRLPDSTGPVVHQARVYFVEV